jgi:Protein of unknown function (DUF2804)
VAPVLLCTPEGRLAEDAIGWSRRPLHTCNLRGRWPRKKRWDYWAITTGEHLLFLLVADVDYLGVGVVSLLDLATGRRFEAARATPFGLGVDLPDTALGAPILFDHLGVRIAMATAHGRTTLEASARSMLGERIEVEIEVEHPPGHDTLGVAVPFGGDRFQLTSKHLGLPARGRVVRGGRAIGFDGAFACLDFGRGVWPRRTRWSWAAGAGVVAGRALALNLGGRWTDGSGLTENGLWIDGRLHKIGERVAFTREPPGVRIRSIGSDRVDLALTPIRGRRVGHHLGLLGARLDWSVGRFSGGVVDGAGARVAVDGLLGWAEELDARW